jgi:hypothetical protein
LAYLDELAGRGLPDLDLPGLAARSFDISVSTFSGHCLTRPAFLDHAERAQLDSDLTALQSMLVSIPGRLFGGDLAAFSAAAGMTGPQLQAILRSQSATATRLARVDQYPDESGFRVMEVNNGSPIGALDSALLNRAFLGSDFVAEFAAAHRLSYIDPMAEMVATMLAECGLDPAARPLVAAIDWPQSYPGLAPLLRSNARQLARLGYEFVHGHLGQLEFAGRRVWLAGRPVEVIYRLFMIEDLLQPGAEELIDPVLDAAGRGEVAMFTPMDSHLYGSKAALAMLSDEEHRSAFSAAELATLDRILPWTRMVRPGQVTVGCGSADLLDYAIAQRHELILKPALMHGGIGIVPGWLTDPADWKAQVMAAMNGPYVLQRRIRAPAEPFPVPGGGATRPWVLGWGVFLGQGGYSGSSVRGHTDPDIGAPSVGARAASLTCCFHQEAPASSG